MTHQDTVARWLAPLEASGGIGVEIGAFKTPVPGITPFYVDRFHEYAGARCLADYYGDAANLPFRNSSLDYVVTSHVLEHTADPVAALAEWYRVLRPGGIIYLVVPDRRFTWDHERPLTSVEHMLEDFERRTTAVDATHIDEFVDQVDWSTYSPGTAPPDVAAKKNELKSTYHAAVAAGNEINIHFHVFEPSNVMALIERLRTWPRTRFRWRLVGQAERFPSSNPNGFLAIVQVDKTWRDTFRGACNRLQQRYDRRRALLPGARSFDSANRPSALRPTTLSPPRADSSHH